MNKRIEELAKQSLYRNYDDGWDWTATDDDLQEFAQLIIKESARFVSILDAEPMSHRSASILLLEHFGIEG